MVSYLPEKTLRVHPSQLAGTLGFQRLKKMSKQGKKKEEVEASASRTPAVKTLSPIVETFTPNAAQGVDQSGVASKKRDRPRTAADGETVRVVDVSEGGSDNPAKKSRAVKKGHKKSSPKMNLKKFTVVDYESYLRYPLINAADICKATADIFVWGKQDEEERTTGNILEA